MSGTTISIFLFFKKIRNVFNKQVDVLGTTNSNSFKELKQVSDSMVNKAEQNNENAKRIFEKCEEIVSVVNQQAKILESLIKEFIQSRRSDKRLESVAEAIALMVSETPELVKNGTAQKICDMLGIKEINENINAEVEAIDIENGGS